MKTFQTVRLARGRHHTPADGVCVAELASMIARERFSDRPKCGCPAVTAFLRGYNDALSDELRQDLYPLASILVGSRADEATTTARGDRLVELAWCYKRKVLWFGCLPIVNFPTRFARYEAAGWHLGRCARDQPDCHAAVLATIEALRADGQASRAPGWPVPGHGASTSSSRASDVARTA